MTQHGDDKKADEQVPAQPTNAAPAAAPPPAQPAQTSESKAEDDLEITVGLTESEIAERTSQAKEIFNQLFKAFKIIRLHRHATSQYAEYLEGCHQALTSFLDENETLPLTVEQTAFKFLKTTVYEEEASDQNLAFKFYRDGIRMLVFHQGLTSKELLDFVLVSMTNVQSDEFKNEDMVSLLWKKDIDNLEYAVVESYSVGDESSDETRVEVDKIVNHLYQRLTSQSTDFIKQARLSLEDLETELENIQQASGVVIGEESAGDRLQSIVQTELIKDSEKRLMFRVLAILLDLFRLPQDEALGQATENGIVQLLDTFILKEDLDGIDAVFRDYRQAQSRPLPPANTALVQRIWGQLVARMGDRQTIEKLAEMLEHSREETNHQRILRYLAHLGPPAVVPILETLEKVNRPETRKLICDVLVQLAKDDLDPILVRLGSPKANLVRDMLYLLGELNPPDKLEHVATLLKHPNLAIRIVALDTIGASDEPQVVDYLMAALEDTDPQVRMTAAKRLPERDHFKARTVLLSIVRSQDFADRPEREQVVTYAALASTNTPEAIEYFRELLRASSLLQKKKLAEQKKAVIKGLAGSGSSSALQMLRAELDVGLKDKDLAAAAERACKRIESQIDGAQPEGAEA